MQRQRFKDHDSKIVGLQNKQSELTTQQLQRFNDQDSKIARLDNKVAELQTEIRQRFNEQDSKIVGLQTMQTEHTALLQKILARLPNNP